MNAQSTAPIDVIRAFNDAMVKMDLDSALQYVAEDCEYTNGPLGTLHGHAGVRAMLEPFFAPIEENEFIILRAVESGPIVFMERLDRHRLAGGWVELPVNGVWEVHAGRITVWHDYFDAATIQNQIAAQMG